MKITKTTHHTDHCTQKKHILTSFSHLKTPFNHTKKHHFLLVFTIIKIKINKQVRGRNLGAAVEHCCASAVSLDFDRMKMCRKCGYSFFFFFFFFSRVGLLCSTRSTNLVSRQIRCHSYQLPLPPQPPTAFLSPTAISATATPPTHCHPTAIPPLPLPLPLPLCPSATATATNPLPPHCHPATATPTPTATLPLPPPPPPAPTPSPASCRS
jgi:hypothetical protein